MPFESILAGLLADTERAAGAVFLDDNGEAVYMVSSGLEKRDLEVAAAYLAIYLRWAGSLAGAADLGDTLSIHIEQDKLLLHATALPEGYSLALLQRPPAALAPAKRQLERAAGALRREVFQA